MKTEPLSRDSLAGHAGGVFDYVSASRLSLWLKCPAAFRFKYVDGIQLPTTPAAFLGKAVHAGLELHYRQRQLGLTLAQDEVARRLVDSWCEAIADEDVSFATTADELVCQRQALTLVQAYLNYAPPDEPRPLAVEAAVEAPLVDPVTGEDLGIKLVGVMDLALPDAKGPIIADFKTTARGGEPLEIMHEVQLSCYAYLFRCATGTSEGSLEVRNIIKTKVPKVEFHRFAPRNEKHFSRLLRVIRAYLDDLDTGKFLYRPGLGCTMCNFRGPCAVSL